MIALLSSSSLYTRIVVWPVHAYLSAILMFFWATLFLQCKLENPSATHWNCTGYIKPLHEILEGSFLSFFLCLVVGLKHRKYNKTSHDLKFKSLLFHVTKIQDKCQYKQVNWRNTLYISQRNSTLELLGDQFRWWNYQCSCLGSFPRGSVAY